MKTTLPQQASFALKFVLVSLLITLATQTFAQNPSADNQLDVMVFSETGDNYLYELSLKNKNGNPIVGQALTAKGDGSEAFCVTGSLGQCTLTLNKGQSVDDLVVELDKRVQAYNFSNALDQQKPTNLNEGIWIALKDAVLDNKLLASDGAVNDQFGYAVSVDGTRAVVSAPGDDSNTGSAYVFEYDGTSWDAGTKLVAADGAAGDRFGISVSVSGDRILVGADSDDDDGGNSGSAYVFDYDGTNWDAGTKLVAADAVSNARFGNTVSVDGNRVLIGATLDPQILGNVGAAYVFDFDGTNWDAGTKLSASDGAGNDQFGNSVSLNGNRALIGAFGDDTPAGDGGSAYVFDFDGTNWNETARLEAVDAAANDWFGWSVSVDGDRALISALLDDDGGSSSGSVYVFEYNGTNWLQDTKLVATDSSSGDQFGYSVSLSGDKALVGAVNNGGTGAAYEFSFDGSIWDSGSKLTANDATASDQFGHGVSISGNRVVIGARLDDDNGSDSGSVYVLEGSIPNNNSVAAIGVVGDKTADGSDLHLFEATVLDGAMVPVPSTVVTFAATPNVKFGSGAVGAAGTCTTGAAGTCTVSATSTVAAAGYSTAVSVGGDEVSSGSPLSYNFVAGAATAANSEVTVSDSPATAGIANVTLTVTARDAFDNLVDNADVTFDFAATTDVAFGMGTTGDAGSCTVLDTNDNGTCSVVVASTVAADYSTAVRLSGTDLADGPAVYTFNPGQADAANSSFTLAETSEVVNNPVTLTATVQDQFGNLVADGTIITFNTNFGSLSGNVCSTVNGVCTDTVNSTTVGTSDITAFIGFGLPVKDNATKGGGVQFGGTQSVTWTPDAASAAQSSFVLSTGTEVVGNDVTLTATIRDQFNNLVADGTLVDFATDLGSLSGNACSTTNGVCTDTVNSTVVGTSTITASVGGDAFGGSDTVLWTPDVANAGQSSFALSTNSEVVGNDVTLTATVRDQFGNLVADGTSVSFGTDFGTLSGNACSTVNGVCTETVSSETVGTSNITATVGGDAFGGSDTVTWSPDLANTNQSSFTLGSNTAVVGIDVVLTATIRDQFGNLVADGTSVSFATDLGSLSGNACSTTNGVCTDTVNSTVVGTSTITASVGGDAFGGSDTVAWTPDVANAGQSSFVLSTASEVVGNDVTLTATIRDQFDNMVADGTSVSFATDFGALSGNACNTFNGVCTDTVNSVTVGSSNITATVGGDAFGGTDNVTWTPAAPAAATSSYEVNVAAITAGQDAIYSAQVFDQFGNAVEDDITVTFTLTNSNGATAPATVTCLTGADVGGSGACSATATSTKVGDTSVVASTVASGDFALTPGFTSTNWTTGPADNTTSTVIASTNNSVANGSDQNVLEANIVDANDNPVVGQLVTFAAPITDITFVDGNNSCITGVDGLCTVSTTSTVAGEYSTPVSIGVGDLSNSPVSFTFVPGPADPTQSDYSVDLATQTVGQDVTYSVVIRDAFMNPVNSPETVNFTLTNSPGVDAVLSSATCTTGMGGTCTTNPTASSTKVGTTSVVANIGGPDLSNPNMGLTSTTWTVDVADATQSSVTVTLNGQTTNAFDTLQATVLDQYDNPIENETVYFTQPAGTVLSASSCDTDAMGVCSVNVSSTTAGTYTSNVTIVDAFEEVGAVEITGSPIDFDIVADVADNTSSSVTVTVDGSVADGVQVNTLQVSINDSNGNPVGGEEVTFAADADLTYVGFAQGDPATCSTAAVGSQGEGTCSVDVVTTVAASYSQAVTISGALSNSPAEFSFVAGAADPDHSAIVSIGPDATANGTDSIEITVELRDAFDNLVGGTTVDFAADADLTYSGFAESAAGTCTTAAIDLDNLTAADGICSVTVTSETAADYSQSVQVGGVAISAVDSPNQSATSSPAEFTFNVGAVDAANSSFSVSDATQVAGQPVTYDAEILDAFDNPIEGLTVQFTMANTATAESGVSEAITPDVTCETDSDGLCNVTTTSYKTGQTVVAAEADGVDLDTPSTGITTVWAPGAPAPANSEYGVDLDSQTVGLDVEYRAIIRDENYNLVGGGVQVDFTMANTNADTPAGSCTTTADLPNTGECTYDATSEETTFDSMGSTQVTAAINGIGPIINNIEFGQDVTNEVIFGSGNTNGEFTTDRTAGVEVGLRAKIPFAGTINRVEDTYLYATNETWNFEWSINTDFDGSTGNNLDQYTYELGLDADPGLGVDYIAFDPITQSAMVPFFDHSIGDNNTAQSGGTEATDPASYLSLLSSNNLLQQSWSYSFGFLSVPLGYDQSVPGNYSIYMLVRDVNGTVVGRSDIQVLIGGAEAVLPFDTTIWSVAAAAAADLTVDVDGQIADGVELNEFSVSVTDEFGNPISGQDVTFSSDVAVTFVSNSCTTDNSGVCSVQASSTTSGTFVLNATVDGFPAIAVESVDFDFVPGAADADHSAITAISSGAVADGSFNSITVEILDAFDNPVENELVTFGANVALNYETFGLGNEGTCTTNAAGTCGINVSSLVAADYSQVVSIGGNALTAVDSPTNGASASPADFTFIAGAPAGATSSYQVSTASEVSATAVTYSAVVRDANNNLVADGNLVTFNLQNSNGANLGGTINGATTLSCTTGAAPAVNGSGECSVDATSLKVGDTAIVSVATAASGDFANAGQATTNWTPGAASAANSDITVSNSPATADNVDAVILTATVRDVNDNLVTSEDTVTFTQPGDITLSSLTCDANDSALGQCFVTALSTKASTYNSSASLAGGTIDNNISYEFVAGPVDFDKSFVTVLTDNAFANGTALNELEASLFDQFFNPVKNTVVAFAATPDVNFGIGSGVARTCNTGQAGSCSMFASSVLEDTYTTSVTVDGNDLKDSPISYTFVDGDVDITTSTVTASLASVDANGIDASIISVQLRDSLNNVLTSGAETVALSGMPASSTIGPVAFDAMTNTYDFEVTNINVDFVEYAATVEIGGMPMPIDDKATVDFLIIDIDSDNLHDPEDPDTANTDTDGDGINDGADAEPNDPLPHDVLPTTYPDTDGDGIRDRADVDVDGDGNNDNGNDFDGDGINDPFDLDSVNPIITVIGGDVSVEQGTTYNDLGATALDNQTGDLTADIVTTFAFDDGINPPTTVFGVDTNTVGVYTVFYNVTDVDGNPAEEKSRTVTVTEDATVPVITLTGDASVTFEAGSLYVDAGATGFDSFDLGGNVVTSDIDGVLDPIPGGHTSLVPATYTITYNLVDAAGNAANPVTREVIVQDTTAPVITLTGDAEVFIEQGNVYTDAGATASDLVDGNLTGSIQLTGSVDTNVVGQYVLAYNVTDAAGNMATTVIRTVNVTPDSVPPVITLNGVSPDTVQEGGVYTDPGATAVDNFDATVAVIVTGVVDTSTPGIYQLMYNASDAAGNAAVEVIREVEVTADNVAPVIQLLGNASESIERGGTYTDAGATATDNLQGDITNSIVVDNPVDTSVPGLYFISYDVSDNRGNAADTVIRSVEVTPDATIPVITLIGTDVTLEQWSSYVDAGATASDNFDGDITGDIMVSSNVNTTVPGNYTVSYDVADSTGNSAVTVTRNVTVTPDVTTPVINLIGDNPQVIEAGDAYTELGANVVDNEPGLTVDINTSDVDTSIPDNYLVFYNVTDSAGNVASTVIRTVIVEDTTAPVINLIGAATIDLEAGDTYQELGADVVDNEPGLTVVIDNSSINNLVPDSYQVTYNVSDSFGNVATEVIRTVNVVDTTAPVITLLGDNPQTIQELEAYIEAGAEATDIVDENATLTAAIVIDSSAVDNQVPGTYPVTYTVSDQAGNQTVETRTVEVTADIPVVQADTYEVAEDIELIADDADGTSTATSNDNSVLVNDNDPDSDGLSVVEVGSFTAGGIGGNINMSADGTFVYIPPSDESGTATFDFTVTDGTHLVPSSLTINVLPVNDAPSFDVMGDVDVTNLVDVGDTTIVIDNFADNFVFGPADESNQSVLQFNINTMDSDQIINSIDINAAGQLTIDFTLNYGVAVVQVTMQDDGGVDNGGVDTSVVEEFVVIHLDIIFKNGFESVESFFTAADKSLLDPKNEALSVYEDGFWFKGHWLGALGASSQSLTMKVVELWMIEILKHEKPFQDFDKDGTLNSEDDNLN